MKTRRDAEQFSARWPRETARIERAHDRPLRGRGARADRDPIDPGRRAAAGGTPTSTRDATTTTMT